MDGQSNAAQGYAAFISYSHQDEKTGRWLHKFLERYRFPATLVGEQGRNGLIGKRIGKIFRDREEFSAGGELKAEIEAALARSDALIVLCSPSSALSAYVNAEIDFFHKLGRADRIIPVIVDGEPPACFPPALHGAERLAADLRPGKDGERRAGLKVISGLVGVGLDELVQRDAAAQRARRTLTIAGAGAVVCALSILGGLWYASAEAARVAEGRRLISAARDMLVQNEISPALALLEEAEGKVTGRERAGVRRVLDAWAAQLRSPSDLINSVPASIVAFRTRQYAVGEHALTPVPTEAEVTLLRSGQDHPSFAYTGDGEVALLAPRNAQVTMLSGRAGGLPAIDGFLTADDTLAFSVGLYHGPTPGTSASAFVVADLSAGALMAIPMGSLINEEGFYVLPGCDGVIINAEQEPAYQYGLASAKLRISSLNNGYSLIQLGDSAPRAADISQARFVPFGLRRGTGDMQAPERRADALRSLLRTCPRWRHHNAEETARLELPSISDLGPGVGDANWLHDEIRLVDFNTRDARTNASIVSESFFPSTVVADREYIYLLGAFQGGIQTRDIAICQISRATSRLEGCSRETALGGYDVESNPARDLLYVGEAGAQGLSFLRTSDFQRVQPDQDMPMGSRGIGILLATFSPDNEHFAILGVDGDVWTYRVERERGAPSRLSFVASRRIAGFSEPLTQRKEGEIRSQGASSVDIVVRVEALTDNRLLLVRGDGALALVDLLSGVEHWKLPAAAGAAAIRTDIALSPAGDAVAVFAAGVLRIIDLDTGLLMAQRSDVALAAPIPNIPLRPLYTGGYSNYTIGPTGQLIPVPGTEIASADIPSITIDTSHFVYDRIRFASDLVLELATVNGNRALPLRREGQRTPLRCLIAAYSENGAVREFDPYAGGGGDCDIVIAPQREDAQLEAPSSTLAVASAETQARSTARLSSPSFDCGLASTAIERAICASAELGDLDREMSHRFAELRRSQPDRRQIMIDQQMQWLIQRDTCANESSSMEGCLARSYRSRISALTQ